MTDFTVLHYQIKDGLNLPLFIPGFALLGEEAEKPLEKADQNQAKYFHSSWQNLPKDFQFFRVK